jgi:CRISPR system Cascade subunit CasE
MTDQALVEDQEYLLSAVPLSHPTLGQRGWRGDRAKAHHGVMGLFPEELPGHRDERRVTNGILFRVEPERDRVLVQHRVPLDATDPAITTVSLSPLLQALQGGLRVRFRCDLNAVRCPSERSSGARRVPIDAPDALAAFLERKIGSGFRDIAVSSTTTTRARRGENALHIVAFSGAATISDPEEARRLVRSGAGKALAYGCGLLSLGPA